MKFLFINSVNVVLFLMVCSVLVSVVLFLSFDGKVYYDDVLDIIWFVDMGYVKILGDYFIGWMSWVDVNVWVMFLVIDGVIGWCLLGMIDIDYDGCI